MKNVAVIGAGASGIISAIFAAKNGNKVTLFEKQKKIGRKISITGNGRCNISNRNLDVSHYHGHNPKFLHNIFSRFGLEDTIDFFSSIGIPIIEEKKGKLFPHSLQASTVVSFLEYELFKHKIDLRLHRRIDTIKKEKNKFVLTTAGKEKYSFDSVILAAGGAAYNQLGGSKHGYELAKSLGHKIYDPFAIILPINIPLKKLHKLEGIKWDCKVEAQVKGRVVAHSFGELLFTKYGISGPVTLEVSRFVNEAVLKSQNPKVVLDLFANKTEEQLESFLEKIFFDKEKTVVFALEGILKKRMPAVLLEIAGVNIQTKCGNLSQKDVVAIINVLKNLQLEPGEVRSVNEAVTTAGGVDVNEINPSTMESKKVPGLYVTGELLDIDGDCGGYNLQFAWSSGAIAGMAQ